MSKICTKPKSRCRPEEDGLKDCNCPKADSRSTDIPEATLNPKLVSTECKLSERVKASCLAPIRCRHVLFLCHDGTIIVLSSLTFFTNNGKHYAFCCLGLSFDDSSEDSSSACWAQHPCDSQFLVPSSGFLFCFGKKFSPAPDAFTRIAVEEWRTHRNLNTPMLLVAYSSIACFLPL